MLGLVVRCGPAAGDLARYLDSSAFLAPGFLWRNRSVGAFSDTGVGAFSDTGVLFCLLIVRRTLRAIFSASSTVSIRRSCVEVLAARRQVGEPEQVWNSEFGIAAAPWPGPFDKAQRTDLAKAARDGVPVANSKTYEISEGDRQLAVVAPAMGGVFDLDAVEDAAA